MANPFESTGEMMEARNLALDSVSLRGIFHDLDITATHPIENASQYFLTIATYAEALDNLLPGQKETDGSDMTHWSTEICYLTPYLAPAIFTKIIETYPDTKEISRQATKFAIALLVYWDRERFLHPDEFKDSFSAWKMAHLNNLRSHLNTSTFPGTKFTEQEFLDLYHNVCETLKYIPHATPGR